MAVVRTLLIMRHGKSDWDAPFERDEDRPLAARGRSAAERVGRYLSSQGIAVDVAVTSPALRASETLRLAAQSGQWSAPISTDSTLYSGSTTGILRLIQQTDPAHQTLLLAGHQPTSAQLVRMLIGGGRLRFPTAAVAAIQFTSAWAQVSAGAGELRWFLTPRMLP